ncbi:OprD family outer membrane porin [Pseudomonas aeruginosa]|nr:OprD family outer membrane porin [Pseudomonas aeruginosa]MCL8372169.1 OprD family porin [Pseudomonas aeruginosa]
MNTPRLIACALLAESVALPIAHADNFLDRSTAYIDFQNYYFDRQFQDNAPPPLKSRYREWAQAINFTYKSDFTEGPVGFGFDVRTLTGIKLDSTPRQSGSGLLPLDSDGRAEDEYSTLGLTAKMRAAKTEINAGQLILNLPLQLSSPARLLPQTFNGVYLHSKDIEGLDFHLGYLDRIKYRDSSNNEKITVSTPNGRFRPAESSGMEFIGADYKVTPELTASLHHAVLKDIYKQQYLGFVHVAPVGGGSLKSDLRLQFSQEDGEARGGPVDNQNLGVNLPLQLQGPPHQRRLHATVRRYRAAVHGPQRAIARGGRGDGNRVHQRQGTHLADSRRLRLLWRRRARSVGHLVAYARQRCGTAGKHGRQESQRTGNPGGDHLCHPVRPAQGRQRAPASCLVPQQLRADRDVPRQ